MSENIVVIGAGQAGQSFVETLRKKGFDGSLTLIGDEPIAPYQRPPLSKKYLEGALPAERLRFKPDSFYQDARIDTMLGAHVTQIDRSARNVVLSLHNGAQKTLPYDKLALATGARPNVFAPEVGGNLPGVFSIRSLWNIDAMRPEVKAGRRAVVIGGGYIGLEAAAVLRGQGLEVTLLHSSDRILSRVAAEPTSNFFRNLHQHHGVTIREGASFARFEATPDGRLAGALTTNGVFTPADIAIVGVGVTPNTTLAEQAGLEVDQGVAVDHQGRTSDPAIFAAGDCASFLYRQERIRLESVQNAIDQAALAAQAMLGAELSYTPQPWFWSDQYDVKLQIAGLMRGYDRTVTREGAQLESGSVWYFKGDTFLAVDAMNDPRAFMMGKRWLQQGVTPNPDKLSDTSIELREAA